MSRVVWGKEPLESDEYPSLETLKTLRSHEVPSSPDGWWPCASWLG